MYARDEGAKKQPATGSGRARKGKANKQKGRDSKVETQSDTMEDGVHVRMMR